MGREAEELLKRVKAWKPAQYKTKEEYEAARKKSAAEIRKVMSGEASGISDEEMKAMFLESERKSKEAAARIKAIKASGKNVVDSVTFPDRESMESYFNDVELDEWYKKQKQELDYKMAHCHSGSSIPDKYIASGGNIDDTKYE